MSGPHVDSDREVLDVPVRRWSGRRRVVAGVVVLVLAAGWLVERRVHGSTEDDLAVCRDRAAAVLGRTDERLLFLADYLRPAMIALPVEGRGSLFSLLSDTAVEYRPAVERARRRCDAVDVVWLHPGLRDRRDDYVTHLDRVADRLDAIAVDGRRYYRDTPSLDAERERLFGGP